MTNVSRGGKKTQLVNCWEIWCNAQEAPGDFISKRLSFLNTTLHIFSECLRACTELHRCAFVAIVGIAVRAAGMASAPLPITKGFTPHCKKDRARDRKGENAELEGARNHAPLRSEAWGWQQLPSIAAVPHKSSRRICRTTDSEQTRSKRIKKQRQLAKQNQNSTERCDTQAGKQTHYLMHMFGNCFRGRFSGDRYGLFLFLI